MNGKHTKPYSERARKCAAALVLLDGSPETKEMARYANALHLLVQAEAESGVLEVVKHLLPVADRFISENSVATVVSTDLLMALTRVKNMVTTGVST